MNKLISEWIKAARYVVEPLNRNRDTIYYAAVVAGAIFFASPLGGMAATAVAVTVGYAIFGREMARSLCWIFGRPFIPLLLQAKRMRMMPFVGGLSSTTKARRSINKGYRDVQHTRRGFSWKSLFSIVPVLVS